MVFGACPVLSFTSPPSSRWVEPREPLQGAAYAVQKAAVFPPRKKKGCFNPCCKQSSDSLCWLSRIASDFCSNAAAAGTEPEELKCGRWIISYPSFHLPHTRAAFCSSFCQVPRYSEKTCHLQTQKQALIRHQVCCHHDVGLLSL
nr:uncharacterized protein LOC110567295 [Aotus nancymaae]